MIQYIDIEYANLENTLSHAEKIALLQNVINMHSIIYGDYLCDRHFDVHEYNMNIADIYLRMDDIGNALDYLEKAYVHAEQFMQYKDGDKYQSLSLKDITSELHSRWSRSPFENLLDRFTNETRYDVIRNNPRFIAIFDKIKLHSADN